MKFLYLRELATQRCSGYDKEKRMPVFDSHSSLEGGGELFWKQQGRELSTASCKVFLTPRPVWAKGLEETREPKS